MSNELKPPESRGEKTLHNMIGGNYPLDPSQSRVESLLIELKNAIEQGSGGADIPTITMDSSTYICTFTADQATYMKSGKPFLIEHWLVMLNEPDPDPYYIVTAINDGAIYIGMFKFDTLTTGHFYLPFDGSSTPVGLWELYQRTISPYKLDRAGENAVDHYGVSLANYFFGFNELGVPGFYPVNTEPLLIAGQKAVLFNQVFASLSSQAQQTGQTVNAYLPFSGETLVGYVGDILESNRTVALAIILDDQTRFLELASAVLRGESPNCTFRGSLVTDNTADPSPTFMAVDVELHFTPTTAALSVSPPKSYTSADWLIK